MVVISLSDSFYARLVKKLIGPERGSSLHGYDERFIVNNRLHWTRLLAFVTGLVNQELLLRK